MKHKADTTAPNNNGEVSTHSRNGEGVGVGGRKCRIISLRTLQNILIVGVVLVLIRIIILYSRLVKIEANTNNDDALRHLWRGNKSTNHRDEPIPHLNHAWLRQNIINHRIPGRGEGSKRGHVICNKDVYRLVSYWNDPRSDVDRTFKSAFLDAPYTSYNEKPKRTRYLSFEPDRGGWNNIRMEFEIMVVFAAATGRTLVLPPDNPLYLLYKDKDKRQRGIHNFFQGFDDILDTISTQDFFQKEMIKKKSYPLPIDKRNRTKVMAAIQKCFWMAKSENSCIYLFDYLSRVADFVPNWHGEHHCLIMDDEAWFRDGSEGGYNKQQQQKIRKFCAKRIPIYYNQAIHDAPLIHFRSHSKDARLLVHFYAFIFFTNAKIGNHYKRLVRDRVRYSDQIFCAAGKITKSLLEESINDKGVTAGYFSMHVRRGDFQWANMRISEFEWYENTSPWLQPDGKHLLYIATDETNLTFFELFMKHYKVRFLSDYSELADLSNLDPNYAGMIDQVVASRSKVFVGTYFSSFSAYIGRMRGYHGLSGKKMYYSHPNYWNQTHSWAYPHSSYSAREYPIGWVGIDEDDEPDESDFY